MPRLPRYVNIKSKLIVLVTCSHAHVIVKPLDLHHDDGSLQSERSVSRCYCTISACISLAKEIFWLSASFRICKHVSLQILKSTAFGNNRQRAFDGISGSLLISILVRLVLTPQRPRSFFLRQGNIFRIFCNSDKLI